MSNLIEAEAYPFFVQCSPNQVAPFGRDVIILLSKYHDQFPFDFSRSVQAIVLLSLAQGVAVNVRREVADCRAYSLVQSTPICQMPP